MSDLIDRQAAIEALLEKGQSSRRYKIGEIWELNFDEIREALNSLPSAEPERKKGKWITEECLPGVAVCSICGHEIRGIGCQYTKYCDECGSRMNKDE